MSIHFNAHPMATTKQSCESLTQDRLHVVPVLLTELRSCVIEHLSHGLIQQFGPDLLQSAVELLHYIIVSDRGHDELQDHPNNTMTVITTAVCSHSGVYSILHTVCLLYSTITYYNHI